MGVVADSFNTLVVTLLLQLRTDSLYGSHVNGRPPIAALRGRSTAEARSVLLDCLGDEDD